MLNFVSRLRDSFNDFGITDKRSYCEQSEDYREQCAEHTKSHYTNLPEIDQVRFFDMSDILEGKVEFLHDGQEWLVESLALRLSQAPIIRPQPSEHLQRTR